MKLTVSATKDRPSSKANDAATNPRNTGNSGGKPYIKPVKLTGKGK